MFAETNDRSTSAVTMDTNMRLTKMVQALDYVPTLPRMSSFLPNQQGKTTTDFSDVGKFCLNFEAA